MTDLYRLLYEYTAARSSAYAYADPEYRSFCTYARLRESQLRQPLSSEGQSLLDDLLSEQANQHSVELEAIFQASLTLNRELWSLH